MTRKSKTHQQTHRHARDGIGAFNMTHDHRLGAIQMGLNDWMIVEEKRVEGTWGQHRYCTELPHFPDIAACSAFGIEEAERRRDALKATQDRSAWRTMRYPLDFMNDCERHLLPGKLPGDWDITINEHDDVATGKHMRLDNFVRDDGLRVSLKTMRLADGKDWLRVAASYSDECPDWETMCEVKDLFVGKARYALQIHPRESEYVNFAIGMLHIFCPISGWTLPDFRALL